MTALRPELPPPPPRIAALPVDERGYPVPWFVEWIDGVPDHRVMDSRKIGAAVTHRRCWICGEPTGRWTAYVIGPMCSITRTIGEPPSHRDCAVWSAQACPHLSRPHARRRGGYPDGVVPPAGHGLLRNPGAVGVWITHRPPQPRRAHAGNDGFLFTLPTPREVLWFCEGREATRDEVEQSVDSGLPLLIDGAIATAQEVGETLTPERARATLERELEVARLLFPVA